MAYESIGKSRSRTSNEAVGRRWDIKVPDLSFDDIYSEFYGKILRYVQRYVGVDAAEDVTQSVFIRVNDSLQTFEGRSSMGTWVYRIATNAALDHVRQEAATKKKLDLAADSPLASIGAPPPAGERASPEAKAESREMRA